MNLAAIGVALTVGIYNLMIYRRRREDLPALFLFLVSMASLLRSMTTTSLILDLLPESSFTISRILEYLTIPVSLLTYQLFLESAFSLNKSTFVSRMFKAANLSLAIFTLITPTEISSKYLHVYQLLFVGTPLYFFYLVILACRQKSEGAYLVLGGFLLMLASAIFDVAITNFGLGSVYLTPIAAAVFLMLQAQLIAKRSATAYEKAEKYAVELIEKEQARTLFFHNTSHELRTPLNGIIGFLELVLSGKYGLPTQAALSKITKALNLAESLKVQVNTILDLAKSKRGELKANVSQFSVEELKKEADQLAEGLCLKSDKIFYESNLHVNQALFCSDKEKIFTIIRNLLGNAFKFRRNDQEHTVTLKIIERNECLIIEVSDTGIGIRDDRRELIFEEFGQLQSDARRAYEGTGLGLSMVKDLTNLLEGKIDVDSKENQGSTFRVELKSLTLDTHQNQLQDSEQKPSIDYERFRTQKVQNDLKPYPQQVLQKNFRLMVIDDNETNCEVISEILESDGYEVRSNVSARIGIEEMRLDKPDLLLLDMMMPEMSGEDVIALMNADEMLKEIPIILITARASEQDRIEGLKLGVDDYLPKPIFATELKLRVGNMLSRHKLLRQIKEAEHNEKLTILGNLFGELTHEIKNILHGADGIREISQHDHLGILKHKLTDHDLSQALSTILSRQLSYAESYEKIRLLSLGHQKDESYKLKKSLRNDLSLFKSSDQESLHIWNQISSMDTESFSKISSYLKIIVQYKILESQFHKIKKKSRSRY